MAETTKKTTAAKKSTATKATANTPAKTTRKKTTKKATAKVTATAPAKTTRKKTTKKATARVEVQAPLLEREPVAILETAGYAATSVVNDVITLVRNPDRLETILTSLRERLGKDLERTLESFTRVVDGRAAEGKKVIEVVVKDERVSRVLDQTSNTRSQLKAALTSVTKTADVAGEAAGKQAETARTQVKGATTSVRNSTEQARSQVKGAATSVKKIADAAYGAASKQAPNAASQVKAAATSVRKTAETVVDAATDTAVDAEVETRN
jgi:hypothetical protein